jgi:hypothetical protein
MFKKRVIKKNSVPIACLVWYVRDPVMKLVPSYRPLYPESVSPTYKCCKRHEQYLMFYSLFGGWGAKFQNYSMVKELLLDLLIFWSHFSTRVVISTARSKQSFKIPVMNRYKYHLEPCKVRSLPSEYPGCKEFLKVVWSGSGTGSTMAPLPYTYMVKDPIMERLKKVP